MSRQLKTFITTSGFFELAVAAPTMKAALEIWGAGRDLFQRGYAKETSDPAIVKATMAKPGTVLQRGVGVGGAFKEKGELPDVSSWEKPARNAAAAKPRAPRRSKNDRAKLADPAAARRAAQVYEAARNKLKREGARAEAAQRKARERRENAIQSAETALRVAQNAHEARMAAIEKARAAIERRAQKETENWRSRKLSLETALLQTKAKTQS